MSLFKRKIFIADCNLDYPLGLTILSNYTLLVADFLSKSIKEYNLTDGN